MITKLHLIAIDRADASQLNAVHALIKTKANGWWHHFGNMWIAGGDLNAQAWRDLISPAITAGGARVLVIRLPKEPADRDWAYFGTETKKIAEWLRSNVLK